MSPLVLVLYLILCVLAVPLGVWLYNLGCRLCLYYQLRHIQWRILSFIKRTGLYTQAELRSMAQGDESQVPDLEELKRRVGSQPLRKER